MKRIDFNKPLVGKAKHGLRKEKIKINWSPIKYVILSIIVVDIILIATKVLTHRPVQ
jgi:hypothetical protein